MNTCPVCGSDAFDELDGYFFCAQCQTQSQNIRQEETADFVATRGLTLRIRGLGSAVTVCPKSQSHPWGLHEMFTLILKAQVDALLKLGVNPKLDDVVFKLWALYLSQTGKAFNNAQEDMVKLKMLADMRPRDRDLRPATIKNPDIEPVRVRMARAKNNMGGMTRAKLHKRQLEDTLGSEEFYEGDNPLLEDQDGRDVENPTGLTNGNDYDDDDKLRGKTYGLSKYTIDKSTSRLTLRMLVSILHLGLLYCHNNVTTGDLYRWLVEGLIPFKNAKTLLPKNMKFSSYDSLILINARIPKPTDIRLSTAQLIVFMNRTHFPLIDLRLLAAKYVMQLALPGELQALVRSLVEQAGPMMDVSRTKTSSKRAFIMRTPEVVTMAIVVILLKMLFILDDYHERKSSRYARAVNTACPSLQLFVWEDWVRRPTSNKISLSELHSVSDVLQVRDVADCLAPHNVECDGTLHAQAREKVYDRFRRQVVRNHLDMPVRRLAEELQSRTRLAPLGDAPQQSQEITDLSATLDIDSTLGDCGEDGNTDGGGSNQPAVALTEDDMFRMSTVKYITEGHAFTQFLKRVTLITPATLDKMQVTSETSDELAQPVTVDKTCTSCEMQEDDSEMRLETQPQCQLNQRMPRTMTGHWHVNVETFQELLDLPHAGCSPYLLDINQKKGALPSSYQKCLNICSTLIDCSVQDIQNWIRRLERKLFSKAFLNENQKRRGCAVNLDAECLERLVKA